MGFLDRFKRQASGLKDKATDAVDKNSDKITAGLDKAGDFVDQRTKGKYSDKIDTAKARAQDGLDRLDGQNDDFPENPPAAAPPATEPPAANPPAAEPPVTEPPTAGPAGDDRPTAPPAS